MLRWAAPIVLLATIGATPAPERTVMKHGSGTFEVVITPETQDGAPASGMPTSRMGLAKTFSGGMTGTASGTMLAAGTPQPGQPAGYVAIDQFRGTVDGLAGGFLLLHRGTMTKTGGGELSIVIAPDSGTDALDGILGTLTIEIKDGKHLYDLSYTLPARR
jgi:hypothetical protein